MAVLADAQQRAAVPPALRALLLMILWDWCDKHAHDVVLTKKVLFVKVTITVADCEWLLVQLLGPRPVVVPA